MKKYPVLVEGVCRLIERMRLSIEVLIGERVRLGCLDLNTGKGEVFVGNVRRSIGLVRSTSNVLNFRIDSEWFVALFPDEGDRDQSVAVSSDGNPNKRETVAGQFTMRWVGTSNTDRHEEPLFKENAEYCAQVRGMTLQQLLDSRP